MHTPTLFLPRENLRIRRFFRVFFFFFFFPFVLCWAEWSNFGKWMCGTLNIHLWSQWSPTWSAFLSTFQLIQTLLHGAPWNVSPLCQSSVLFPSPKKGWNLGVFFQLYHTVLRRGNMASECYGFSYTLWCSMGCRSHLTCFWISHKGDYSVYCC